MGSINPLVNFAKSGQALSRAVIHLLVARCYQHAIISAVGINPDTVNKKESSNGWDRVNCWRMKAERVGMDL